MESKNKELKIIEKSKRHVLSNFTFPFLSSQSSDKHIAKK